MVRSPIAILAGAEDEEVIVVSGVDADAVVEAVAVATVPTDNP